MILRLGTWEKATAWKEGSPLCPAFCATGPIEPEKGQGQATLVRGFLWEKRLGTVLGTRGLLHPAPRRPASSKDGFSSCGRACTTPPWQVRIQNCIRVWGIGTSFWSVS